jgi:hypothetical protein
MSGNENEDAGYDDTQKIIMDALRAAKAEITQAQSHARGLAQGLQFLRKASNYGFSAHEELSGDGNVLLKTNISVKKGSGGNEPLTLTVTPAGAISGNIPQAAPSPEGRAAMQGFDHFEVDDSLKEAFGHLERKEAPADAGYASTTAAIIEVARMAVLHDIVDETSATDEPRAVTAEEKAVLEGLRRGREEMQQADSAKEAYLREGLDFLQAQAKGGLRVTTAKVMGAGDIEIKISATPSTSAFLPTFVRINAAGMMKTGKAPAENSLPKYDETEQDALKEADAAAVLAAIAKEAALAGQIPLTSAEPGDSVAARAVAAGISAAASDVRATRTLAHRLMEGLEELNKIAKENGGTFRAVEKTQHVDGSVTLGINSGAKLTQTEITIDALGKIKVSGDSAQYTAFDENDITAVLTKVARNAMQRRQLSAPGTTGPRL